VRESHEISNCERLELANGASPVTGLPSGRRLWLTCESRYSLYGFAGWMSGFSYPSMRVATDARQRRTRCGQLLGAANVRAGRFVKSFVSFRLQLRLEIDELMSGGEQIAVAAPHLRALIEVTTVETAGLRGPEYKVAAQCIELLPVGMKVSRQ
jgi:hypothetical protein